MPKKPPQITHYAEYLKLDELLALQRALSESPDELHFIVVHQVHELWFKLAIHHLQRARTAMDGDQPIEAARLIGQVTHIFGNLLETTRDLHSLPPAAFHQFRHLLAPASGMQSFQFREIEVIAGRRDETFLKWVKNTFPRKADWSIAEKHLAQPSLADAFDTLLARCSVPDCAALYADRSRWPEIYSLADALSAFEHVVGLWRQAHLQLIERTIGAGTVGTGGTTNEYLQRAALVKFFPKLWEARNELSRRIASDEPPSG